MERAREAAHSELQALQAQLATAHGDILAQTQETKSQQRRAELATARAKQLESMLSQTRADAFRRGLEGQQAGGRLSVLHDQNLQLTEQVASTRVPHSKQTCRKYTGTTTEHVVFLCYFVLFVVGTCAPTTHKHSVALKST